MFQSILRQINANLKYMLLVLGFSSRDSILKCFIAWFHQMCRKLVSSSARRIMSHFLLILYTRKHWKSPVQTGWATTGIAETTDSTDSLNERETNLGFHSPKRFTDSNADSLKGRESSPGLDWKIVLIRLVKWLPDFNNDSLKESEVNLWLNQRIHWFRHKVWIYHLSKQFTDSEHWFKHWIP